MDVSRLFLILGALVAAFMATTYVVLSNPALQWPGVDNFVWPTALVLLVISSIATAVPIFPRGKRAIAASPHKRSFAVGYFMVAGYTAIGVCTIVLIPFRTASGI
jgi:membrane protease YdiL (CAAX protease family)